MPDYLFPFMNFAFCDVFKTLIPPTPADRIEAADFGLKVTSGSVSSSLAELSSSSLDLW